MVTSSSLYKTSCSLQGLHWGAHPPSTCFQLRLGLWLSSCFSPLQVHPVPWWPQPVCLFPPHPCVFYLPSSSHLHLPSLYRWPGGTAPPLSSCFIANYWKNSCLRTINVNHLTAFLCVGNAVGSEPGDSGSGYSDTDVQTLPKAPFLWKQDWTWDSEAAGFT